MEPKPEAADFERELPLSAEPDHRSSQGSSQGNLGAHAAAALDKQGGRWTLRVSRTEVGVNRYKDAVCSFV